MSRPTTHADLSDYQRQGEVIFTWNYKLPEHPEVEQWLVKAKLEARKKGFEITQTEVRVPKTRAELDAALKEAQDRWDSGEVSYQDLANGHRSYDALSWTEKNAANFYASCEGIANVEAIRDQLATLAAEEVSA